MPAPANSQHAQTMTPNAHERAEWLRLSQDAFMRCHYEIAQRFAFAGYSESMPLAEFDSLQADYRAWLLNGALSLHPSK